jgi:hypothetical protein
MLKRNRERVVEKILSFFHMLGVVVVCIYCVYIIAKPSCYSMFHLFTKGCSYG